MKKLFQNKDKDLFGFIIYYLFIIRKSFIRQNTGKMLRALTSSPYRCHYIVLEFNLPLTYK